MRMCTCVRVYASECTCGGQRVPSQSQLPLGRELKSSNFLAKAFNTRPFLLPCLAHPESSSHFPYPAFDSISALLLICGYDRRHRQREVPTR